MLTLLPGDYVSNSLMYSRPKHIFWITLLKSMRNNRVNPIYYTKHLDIMYSAGPGIVNRVYQQYKIKYKLKSFPHEFFQPFGQTDDILNLNVSNAYCIHASKGCWHSTDSFIIVIISRNWKIFLFIFIALIGINSIYYFLNRKKYNV